MAEGCTVDLTGTHWATKWCRHHGEAEQRRQKVRHNRKYNRKYRLENRQKYNDYQRRWIADKRARLKREEGVARIREMRQKLEKPNEFYRVIWKGREGLTRYVSQP